MICYMIGAEDELSENVMMDMTRQVPSNLWAEMNDGLSPQDNEYPCAGSGSTLYQLCEKQWRAVLSGVTSSRTHEQSPALNSMHRVTLGGGDCDYLAFCQRCGV